MNVDELNYVDLKLELEKRRMDSSGVQSVLAERLKKAIQSESERNLQESSKNMNNAENKEKSQIDASGYKNLWVTDFPPNLKAQDLDRIFSKHGKVLYTKIFAKDEQPGKCFGFVAMANSEDADNCMSHLNNTEVNGQIIQITKVKREPGCSKASQRTSPTTSQASMVAKPYNSKPPKEDFTPKKTREPGCSKASQRTSPTTSQASMVAKPYNSKPPKEDFTPKKTKHFAAKMSKKFRTVIIAGNSIARYFGTRTILAARHKIDIDLQCWPNANLSTILNNLRSYINPTHQVILLFGLTFEAWHFIPLLENMPQPKILFPNPNFNLESVAQQMDSFVRFCLSLNPFMKVILVVPTIQDMFAYNVSKVRKYSPEYVNKFASSPTFNAKSMANYSREVYYKISNILWSDITWYGKNLVAAQKIMKAIPTEPHETKIGLKIRDYLTKKSDSLNIPVALIDGLHPTVLFIKRFWVRYAIRCLRYSEPYATPNTILPNATPPHFSHPDRLARNSQFNYNVQKGQNLVEYNHLMRDGQVMHPEQARFPDEEKRRKEEAAEKLLGERVKIRLEKQKLEREKDEFLRLEQEHIRIEREREEIRILQRKYEHLCAGHGIKRPIDSSSENETPIYHQNSKRAAPDRNALSWSSDCTSYRSGMMPTYERDLRSNDSRQQPPPTSFRENRISRDFQYHWDSESSGIGMDSWRLGSVSHTSKNSDLGHYETTSSRLEDSDIGSVSQSGCYSSGQSSSINMSNSSWGNNSRMLNQTSNSNMPDRTGSTMNMMGMTDSISQWGWSGTHRLE